jgi:hypothetical protein
MTTKSHPWHRCYLHGNHKFISGVAPRTARQAFGHSLDQGHRTGDTWVFWVCAAGCALLLCLGVV